MDNLDEAEEARISAAPKRGDVIGFNVALGILALAIISPLTFVVAALLGNNGLGLIHGLTPDVPLIGATFYQPGYDVTLNDHAHVSITPVPERVETEAPDGKILAELTGPYKAHVTLWSLSRTQQLFWLLQSIAAPLLVALGAWWMFQIVRSAKHGQAFTRENARRLNWLAGLVMAGGTMLQWSGQLLRLWLLDQSVAAPIVATEATLSFIWIGAGLILAILGEVWRRGVQLEADVEGLV